MRTLIIFLALIIIALGLGFFFIGDTPKAEAPTVNDESSESSPESDSSVEDTENTADPTGSAEDTQTPTPAGGNDVGAEFPRPDEESSTGQ